MLDLTTPTAATLPQGSRSPTGDSCLVSRHRALLMSDGLRFLLLISWIKTNPCDHPTSVRPTGALQSRRPPDGLDIVEGAAP